jgi:nucleotide-binding universal stress UspA family protein
MTRGCPQAAFRGSGPTLITHQRSPHAELRLEADAGKARKVDDRRERRTTMYATILWATDGAPEADVALREALELLEPGGTIVALHCDQRFMGGRLGGASVEIDEPERQEHIAAQVEDLRRDGVNVNYLVESTHHDPSHEIPAVASDLDVDAIVCGTTAPHGLNALLNGSVAARILKRATVPVIVVPTKAIACHPDAAAV